MKETLFYIFSPDEINNNTYKMDRIMVDIVKFLNISHSDINRFHHDYSYTTAQQKHKSTQKIVCSIIIHFKY